MATTGNPAPLCVHALGDDWIDPGTSALTRHRPPRPVCLYADAVYASPLPSSLPLEDAGVPMAGSLLLPAALSTVVRIPIPGMKDLAIALSPQNWKGKSTSVLFFQDSKGKRTLRLDYGPNKATGHIDYHWNVSKTYQQFGIADHTVASPSEARAYRALKAFKYLGRVLLVAGLASDAYSVVLANKPLRRGVQVAGSWAGSWAGCETIGAGGAWLGVGGGPWGIAVGAGVGCIIGGWVGYEGGSRLGTVAYDWAENTVFTALPATEAP